jgi:hypothetical protein
MGQSTVTVIRTPAHAKKKYLRHTLVTERGRAYYSPPRCKTRPAEKARRGGVDGMMGGDVEVIV